jgi:hypothetical protein
MPEQPATGQDASASAPAAPPTTLPTTPPTTLPTTLPSTPPGNNGTVKIHDGADEPAPEARNQPHVCTFHVHARGFDASQSLEITVLSWPPTGSRSVVLDGTLETDGDGAGRWPDTGALSLPDGHYRLVVDTGDELPTRDKHKMFWVRCADQPVPGGSSDLGSQRGHDSGDLANGSGAGANSGHNTGGAALSGTAANGSASAASDAGATVSAASLASSAVELATTGAGPIALIAAVGVGLVALGLALRRRRAPM